MIESYSSFQDSPASEGRLQYDLWGETPECTPYLDWNSLKTKVQTGLRNSDNRLIEKELKWKPEWSLSAGLKETYAWINDQVRVLV